MNNQDLWFTFIFTQRSQDKLQKGKRHRNRHGGDLERLWGKRVSSVLWEPLAVDSTGFCTFSEAGGLLLSQSQRSMGACVFPGVEGDTWLAPFHPPPTLYATDLLEDPEQECKLSKV